MTAEEVGAALQRLSRSVDLKDASDASLVLEAIYEEMSVKRELFEALDVICAPECLFGSNTSSLSITEMANGLQHEEKFLGIHFFNPAPVMKLVEIIRGDATSDETMGAALDLVRSIGKEPVICRESPGFIVNRILIPMINEAVDLLDRGVASREDIDQAMKLGANHPMGPLELADFVGVDIVLPLWKCCTERQAIRNTEQGLMLKRLVRAGKLGRKSGEGFYQYKK